MSGWEALERELAAWHADGKALAVWWRDDDACEDTQELRRLLSLAAEHRMPLLLAAIPARLQPSLATALAAGPPGVFICQHGYAHENHAPPTAKKIELCARPFGSGDLECAAAALAKGAKLLAAALSDGPAGDLALRRLPVLVPPWNRIEGGLVARLPQLGFEGLSTFGPHPCGDEGPVVQINCHLDIFQWKPARRFRGAAELVSQLTTDLKRRRDARPFRREPYGLLTHHLVHDEDCWRFLDRLLSLLRRQAAVQLARPPDLFGARRRAAETARAAERAL